MRCVAILLLVAAGDALAPPRGVVAVVHRRAPAADALAPSRGIAVVHRRALAPLMVVDRTFRRAEDILYGVEVPAREIVNVLGRFKTHKEWNDIGLAKLLDDPKWDAMTNTEMMSAPEYASLQANVARTPQRRRMLTKMGQAQRFLLVDNVPSLAFTSKAMAASVGLTVRELNDEPPTERALMIVFDAMSVSKSGIVEKVAADKRRASWESDDGSFDSDAFASDLSAGRLNILAFAAAFPVYIWHICRYGVYEYMA